MIRKLICILSIIALSSCGGGGSDPVSSSGNSSVGAPISITGKTVTQTVTRNDGSPNVIGIGKTITYSFIDANTILGDGLVTLPTTSWSYSLSGNVADVQLTYSVGWARDKWTFTSESSGTYRSDTGLITGTTGWHEGTFVVSDYTGSSGNTSSNPGSNTGNTTPNSGTGQIAVWSADPFGGAITVNIDGSYAGTLTRYYTSSPTCGGSGTITKTLTVGSHRIEASSSSGKWGPSTFNITAGGCLVYQLNH